MGNLLFTEERINFKIFDTAVLGAKTFPKVPVFGVHESVACLSHIRVSVMLVYLVYFNILCETFRFLFVCFNLLIALNFGPEFQLMRIQCEYVTEFQTVHEMNISKLSFF